MLLYHTVKEIRTAFHLRPLLLIPTTSLSLSTTVHLCTQHLLTSVSLSLSTLYHPLVPSGSQWRMPEPGEVAREAGQRNLPRHQHQLQTHHARVTRPRTGLLSWDYSALPRGSLAQRQEHSQHSMDGKRRRGTRPCKCQNGSSQFPALPQTPGMELQPSTPPARSRSCLPPAPGPSQGQQATSSALHTQDGGPAGQPSLADQWGGWPVSHPNSQPQPRGHPSIPWKQKSIRKAKKPKDAPGSETSHPKQGHKTERQRAQHRGLLSRAARGQRCHGTASTREGMKGHTHKCGHTAAGRS